jgi:hypothetical protein
VIELDVGISSFQIECSVVSWSRTAPAVQNGHLNRPNRCVARVMFLNMESRRGLSAGTQVNHPPPMFPGDHRGAAREAIAGR